MGAFGNFLSLRAGRDAASTLFAALALVVGLTSSVMFYDGDTNWHVATGLWILDHRVVPTSDIFSFTAAGRKWVTHEWLSELLMGTAFKVFGWSGVRVLTAVAFAVASGVLARELLRHVGLVAGLMVVAVIFPVLVPHVIARPHTLALPILAIFVAELLRARRTGQRPSLWLLPLMVLWANIHGSYILGPVFAGFFALDHAGGAHALQVGGDPAVSRGDDGRARQAADAHDSLARIGPGAIVVAVLATAARAVGAQRRVQRDHLLPH